MNDNDVIASIRASGDVAEPPARDAAYRHAMRSVRKPMRFGARRALTAFVAAATLVIPAGVFQAVGTLDDQPDLIDTTVQPTTPAVQTPASNGNPSPGTDPKPDKGKDDERGHKGQGEPGGPSDENVEDRGNASDALETHRPF